MAPKKPALTTKILQALLTHIGSASSGTKSTLLARFQRDVQRRDAFGKSSEWHRKQLKIRDRKLRVMSIDMGIKNLAFCDAEISHPVKSTAGPAATMKVLRWKKIDLVPNTKDLDSDLPERDGEASEAAEDADPYSPPLLSRTALQLITNEVLAAHPDIILIEKQRWRSGGGSAVLQWTVRVNTLEAMLWAILETVKTLRPETGTASNYHVFAVDPKRVGQYWLGSHARALQEKDQDSLTGISGLDTASVENSDESSTSSKKPSRSKAEKSAKIALLRSWLADEHMSTLPSTPSSTPHIAFSIAPSAEPTRRALLPSTTAKRARKGARAARLGEIVPAAEMKKLDDVTDCFLQAAAWVAWDLNRAQLLSVLERSGAAVDEPCILSMADSISEV